MCIESERSDAGTEGNGRIIHMSGSGSICLSLWFAPKSAGSILFDGVRENRAARSITGRVRPHRRDVALELSLSAVTLNW